MPAWICSTCAVQYADTDRPPQHCPICEDERQYVGWNGQQWTTRPELTRDHATRLREEEPGLIGIGVEPAVGIGPLSLTTNVITDCQTQQRRSDLPAHG